MTLQEALADLARYDGPEIRIMEVCGTHTAAIMQGGLRSLLPKGVTLISGPGCPVCITPGAYIDRAVGLAFQPGHRVYAFGDMLKVRGTTHSLADTKAEGADIRFLYAPLELLERARQEPHITHVFAAVGFETTAPVYAMLVKKARGLGITNLKLLTAVRTVPPALELILSTGEPIDAFIAPGHVSAIIGSDAYTGLSARYGKPFTVAGFTPEHIVLAVWHLVRAVRDMRRQSAAPTDQLPAGDAHVANLYPGVVRHEGNPKAIALLAEVFEPGESAWRGIGVIPGSGLFLRPEYAAWDAGSRDLDADPPANAACRCTDVILGRIQPPDCPMFGTACTPSDAQGPCMVSAEGACGIWYRFRGA